MGSATPAVSLQRIGGMLVAVFVMLTSLAACDGVALRSPSSPSLARPSATPLPSVASPSAVESAEGAVPPELEGTWGRVIAGQEIQLTLDGTGYRIQRGPAAGSGQVAVDADRIEFFGSNLCQGTGAYSWAIEDGRLRFTPLGDEPCDGRDVLVRGTFGR